MESKEFPRLEYENKNVYLVDPVYGNSLRLGSKQDIVIRELERALEKRKNDVRYFIRIGRGYKSILSSMKRDVRQKALEGYCYKN